MKEVSEFHFIESQHQHFHNAQYGEDYFEEQKIAHNYQGFNDKQIDQQNIIETPKPKRGRKLSIKNNPQDNSLSKINRLKQKKFKSFPTDKQKQKNPNQLFGHWSVDENKRYHWFLQIHHSHFMNRSLRRMDRIFTTMAKFVGTREAQQCRSHHQKMQKKHKTFPKILLALRLNYYGSKTEIELKEDIEKNVEPHQITMNEPLLTEQCLNENLVMKESFGFEDYEKDNEKLSPNDSEEQLLPIKREGEGEKVNMQVPSADMIEQILAPDIQSSKNYFKFLTQNNQDRSNILDDGYESNLPFHGFF